MQPEMMARILSHTVLPAPLPDTSAPPPHNPELTEREILAAVMEGESSKEIAMHLGITESTVKAHLTNIYTKLGVDSRASAVAVAIERGVLLPRQRTSKQQPMDDR